jgi:RNA polymerase sigma-70 factor (ECF subfamily)
VSERQQLINLAYRMLGSLSDAEDVVQETYARWYAMTAQEQQAIDVPEAWLTKVASRICLDLLRSARVRRERYVGEWVPEPLPSEAPAGVDPADRVTLDESVHMAFLVILDSMTPAERVAFILHDVFRYPFPEVAEIVGRTPAACRQLAASARRRIATAQNPPPLTVPRSELIGRFKRAWEAADIQALITLLDPDVTATADGGGVVQAALYPVHGNTAVAEYFLGLPILSYGRTLRERTVNGQPGLVIEHDGVIETVIAFDIADHRIANIWAVRNPEKLRPWTS